MIFLSNLFALFTLVALGVVVVALVVDTLRDARSWESAIDADRERVRAAMRVPVLRGRGAERTWR